MVSPLDITEIAQAGEKRLIERAARFGRVGLEIADAGHARLSARREGPGRRGGDEPDEIPPLHALRSG